MSCSSASRGTTFIPSWLIIILEYTGLFSFSQIRAFYILYGLTLNSLEVSFFSCFRTLIMLTSDGSFIIIFLLGSITSRGKVTQWQCAALPPCFGTRRFIHGYIPDIKCCSTIIQSLSSTPGSKLFSLETHFDWQFVLHICHICYFLFSHQF